MRRRNRLLMCGKTNTPNWLNMAKVKIEVECHEHKCIWRAKKKERKKTMPQSRISNILQTMSDKKKICVRISLCNIIPIHLTDAPEEKKVKAKAQLV